MHSIRMLTDCRLTISRRISAEEVCPLLADPYPNGGDPLQRQTDACENLTFPTLLRYGW